MRLADFIAANTEAILLQWDSFARTISKTSAMDGLALRDHAGDILVATIEDMTSSQDIAQRSAKSRGQGGGALDSPRLNGASENHAIGRLGSGFDLMEVVSEYRALRASVLQLWHESAPEPHDRDVYDLTRFNESIDQSLAKAVSSFTKRVDEARDMFLAILSHDLRNPLNAIAMTAASLPSISKLDEDGVASASSISSSAAVMARMISDLLDYTRTRLGAGMPITCTSMNLATVAREVFDEFHAANPGLPLRFVAAGDLAGEWDAARLRQVISNLLGNAIQHGDQTLPIELSLSVSPVGVSVAVGNQGDPIPPGELVNIFDPLVRGAGSETRKRNRPGSIGLGLYIARVLVTAHGGHIEVQSSLKSGTLFTFHLPRHLPNIGADIRPGASLAAD